jgi:hypothetical protein
MTAENKLKSTKEEKRRPAPLEEIRRIEITDDSGNIRCCSAPEGIATTILTVSPGTDGTDAS